ncbi:hypothetical protein BD309DRAFT_82413 [Dichomitus squalens]|nr:hypothetical protein BD309DRAFT_82413 [Dichomitus squalens]
MSPRTVGASSESSSSSKLRGSNSTHLVCLAPCVSAILQTFSDIRYTLVGACSMHSLRRVLCRDVSFRTLNAASDSKRYVDREERFSDTRGELTKFGVRADPGVCASLCLKHPGEIMLIFHWLSCPLRSRQRMSAVTKYVTLCIAQSVGH